MTTGFETLIGLCLGMILILTAISVWSLIIAVKCQIDIGAMKQSTHTIQYVDPAKVGDDELAKQMAEYEGKFYERELDDRRDADGPAL